MAIKWFFVTFIFTIIFSKWAFADKDKYLSLSKGLEGKLVAISGKEIDLTSLKEIHENYRQLILEYKSTKQQEDYKVRFRTLMVAFYGEIVRINVTNITPDKSDKTHNKNPIFVNFWKDEATRNFYEELTDPSQTSQPRQLTHKPEIDETWKDYLALRIKLNEFGILDELSWDDYKDKAVERLQALEKLIDQTPCKSDKMSMALFFIKNYEEIDAATKKKLLTNEELKKKYEKLRGYYFGKEIIPKDRYLLLKSELDEVLIRLWTNKDKSSERNNKFQNDVCEARYLYDALMDELIATQYRPEMDYDIAFVIYMILTHDEMQSIYLHNTVIIWNDEKIEKIYESFIDDFLGGIKNMKPKEYFEKFGSEILSEINRWTEADKPPVGLKNDIEQIYVALFLHEKTGQIAVDDVPREIFEKYHIKNELANREIDPEPMAFEKLIRLMGPIKPKLIKFKRDYRDFGLLRHGSSPLRSAHTTTTN